MANLSNLLLGWTNQRNTFTHHTLLVVASRKLIFSLYSVDVTNTVSSNACILWRTVEIEDWAEKLYKTNCKKIAQYFGAWIMNLSIQNPAVVHSADGNGKCKRLSLPPGKITPTPSSTAPQTAIPPRWPDGCLSKETGLEKQGLAPVESLPFSKRHVSCQNCERFPQHFCSQHSHTEQ